MREWEGGGKLDKSEMGETAKEKADKSINHREASG